MGISFMMKFKEKTKQINGLKDVQNFMKSPSKAECGFGFLEDVRFGHFLHFSL